MKNRLERRYGWGHLHFITCSCYRRLPFFDSEPRRDVFLRILREVRDRYDFALLGYVVMPEHIHLLISKPRAGHAQYRHAGAQAARLAFPSALEEACFDLPDAALE